MGFAKSRPVAQRPAAQHPVACDSSAVQWSECSVAHGLRRPRGLGAWWPSDPVLISRFFCPALNPPARTDLHRVWACKMEDDEFELAYNAVL